MITSCHQHKQHRHVYIYSSFLQRGTPDEKAAVGPWLLALFVFVVCGSGQFSQLPVSFQLLFVLTYVKTRRGKVHLNQPPPQSQSQSQSSAVIPVNKPRFCFEFAGRCLLKFSIFSLKLPYTVFLFLLFSVAHKHLLILK